MSIYLRLFVFALILFILAPIIVVVFASFSATGIAEFPPSTWSLKWYPHALSQDLFTEAAVTSVWLALLSTSIGVPFALGAAIVLVRTRFPGRDAIQTFLLAPLVVPSIVIGLSILLAFAAAGIRDVPVRLVGAHVLVTFPYLVRTIMASLTRIDRNIEEAALTLGASHLMTFWKITVPLIRPGIIAGMLFAFIVSFDNVSVSLFLTNVKLNTLPLAILNYVEYNYDPSVAAISTMLIAFSLVSAVVLERLVGLRRVVGG